MTTRDAFLAKVRAAQPAARPRPDVPLFNAPGGDLRASASPPRIATMGGTCVEARAPRRRARALIRERFGPDAV